MSSIVFDDFLIDDLTLLEVLLILIMLLLLPHLIISGSQKSKRSETEQNKHSKKLGMFWIGQTLAKIDFHFGCDNVSLLKVDIFL